MNELSEKEKELLDLLQVFWVKYINLYNYDASSGETPHRDIAATVVELQNIQNRLLARVVRRANPERFTD